MLVIVDYKDIIPIPTFFYYINVDDNQDIQTPRPLGVIDLTEYGPGSIKINVANIQDGSGKRRKKKTRKKRKKKNRKRRTKKKSRRLRKRR